MRNVGFEGSFNLPYFNLLLLYRMVYIHICLYYNMMIVQSQYKNTKNKILTNWVEITPGYLFIYFSAN